MATLSIEFASSRELVSLQIEILPESRLGKRSTCFNVEKKIWQRRHISSSPFRRLQSVQQQRNRDYRQRPIGFPEQAPPPRALAPPLLRCGFGGGIRPRNLSFSFCFFCCWVRFFFFRSFLLGLLGLFVFCCFFCVVHHLGSISVGRSIESASRVFRSAASAATSGTFFFYWNVSLRSRLLLPSVVFGVGRFTEHFCFFFVLFLLFFLQYPF